MKRMQITINADGTSDIDLQEGFSGMSCIEKSKEIEVILGGEKVEQKQKPEMFEGDDVSIDLGIDIGF